MASVAPVVASSPGESRSCRALVVEDDRALNELLTDFLELQGMEVTTVTSGDRALEALAAPEPPELVLLDIRIPGVPGDEVLRRIRADPRLSRIPVAAITGMSLGDLELLAAPDALLTKPVDTESLRAVLARLCGGRPRGAEP